MLHSPPTWYWHCNMYWKFYHYWMSTNVIFDDVVYTTTDICKPSSPIGIGDRGGLVRPCKHILSCMRVSKIPFRYFIDYEGMPLISQKMLIFILTYIYENDVIKHLKCTVHASCTVRTLTTRYIWIRLYHETKSQQIKSIDLRLYLDCPNLAKLPPLVSS